jgi:hemoglobin
MPNEFITEEQIGNLVDQFYARVRVDPEIGPIFNAAIADWPAHLALLKDFWSSVLLTTGRYKGNPMLTHLQLPLEPQHFRRWLALFAETARETLPPAQAEAIIFRSQRIAENFLAAIALQRAGSAPV